jgi:hypothetical protein
MITINTTPHSLSEEVGLALGHQAGEQRLREVVTAAGFTRFRRVAQTPSTSSTRPARSGRSGPSDARDDPYPLPACRATATVVAAWTWPSTDRPVQDVAAS